MLKETYVKDIWANAQGDIFSTKRKKLRQLTTHKVHNGKREKKYFMTSRGLVHRLVASAFIGDITNMQVNHIDGNPGNNSVSNLEIVTPEENIAHSFKTGLTPTGEKHSRAKYTDTLLLNALRCIQHGESCKQVAKSLNISQSYLNKVKNGVYRKYLLEQM